MCFESLQEGKNSFSQGGETTRGVDCGAAGRLSLLGCLGKACFLMWYHTALRILTWADPVPPSQWLENREGSLAQPEVSVAGAVDL